MSSAYLVTHMAPGDEEQSYPLLYGAGPSPTLRTWQHFCEHMRGGAQKLLVARNPDGYIQGLCAYFETEHLSRGRLLDVPFFLVASAADPQGVADDLVRALKRTCGEHGCAAGTGRDSPERLDRPLVAELR